MRTVLVLILMLNSLISEATSIDEIRKSYRTAIESSTATEKLSSDLNKIKKPDPIILAYKASVEALKAKHAWSPFTKLQYMESHKKLMDHAVQLMPENMEIRYLRYNIQYNVPSYLGFSNNLNEDKKFIIDAFIHKKFNTANKVLINDVYTFMVKTKSVNADEKLKMEKVLKSL